MSSKLPPNAELTSNPGPGFRGYREYGSMSHQKSQLDLPIPASIQPGPSPGSSGAGIQGSVLNTTTTSSICDREFFASTPFTQSPNQDEHKLGEPPSFAATTVQPPDAFYSSYLTVNRGETLLKSLTILARVQKQEQEKQRLGLSNGAQKQRGAAGRKPDKPEPTATPFEFTSDMFNSSNPAAFYNVTHFLFEILDPSETEILFRACWPLCEKKQESEYRRAAFGWANKIVKANPEFFPNCALQFPLFVNPYGDRFLRFMGQLVAFVMYNVAQRRLSDREIMKPNYAVSNEEKIEQAEMYHDTRLELIQMSVYEVESTMHMIEKHNERKAASIKEKEDNQRVLAHENETLREAIGKNPHLFPEDALNLIDIRSEKIKAEAKSIDCDPTNYSITDDNLATVVTREWESKLNELKSTFNKITDFCNKHVKLCRLVEAMENNGKIVLDGSKLLGLRKLKNPDLGEYFQNMLKTIEKIYEDAEQVGKPSEELINTIELQMQRKEMLMRQSESLGNITRTSGTFEHLPLSPEEEEQFRQEVLFETKSLQIKLDETKWNRLSKCASTSSPEKLFTWTPVKAMDAANISFLGRSTNGNNTSTRRDHDQSTSQQTHRRKISLDRQ